MDMAEAAGSGASKLEIKRALDGGAVGEQALGEPRPPSGASAESGGHRKRLFVILFLFVGILLVIFLPALSRARARAERINCAKHLREIGLAFKTWTFPSGDEYSFNVGTNRGGTLEWSLRDESGFDKNSWRHFQVLSNELGAPKLLVCPSDHSKQGAADFSHLRASNVTYLVHSGTDVNEETPNQVLAVCPIHHQVLLCDGSVISLSEARWQQVLGGTDRP